MVTDVYLYLSFDAVHLAAAAILFAILPRERAMMLHSGVILIPLGLVLAPMVQGTYWVPQRVFGGTVGIEDVLFCIAFGMLSWGFTALFTGPLPRYRLLDRDVTRRALPLVLVAIAAYVLVLVLVLGASYGFAQIGSVVAVSAVTLARRPDLARHAAIGALSMSVYYVAMLAVWLTLLAPQGADMWVNDNHIGPALMGIPVEEFLWVTFFGAAWVPFMLFGARRSIGR